MNDSAFNLLHAAVRRVVYEQNWTKLHPIQEATIKAFNESDADLLLISPTASGKTEAWLLPTLSAILIRRLPSVQALCISPLKALINDQSRRLSEIAKPLGIGVLGWHGEVGQHLKQALRQSPSGICIITPESIESMLMNRSSEVPKLFGHLQWVVVDEVHAMVASERGIHLQSLLSRLFNLIGHRPRHIGLSATVGDIQGVTAFLNLDHPESVQVIQQNDDGREWRILISAYATTHEE